MTLDDRDNCPACGAHPDAVSRAITADRAGLAEAVRGLYDDDPDHELAAFGPDEFWVDGEPYIRAAAVLRIIERVAR